MAEKIPEGPGQQESIGMGKSRRDPEKPGLYYHPRAKTYVHVSHYAAADAVVQMGYKLIEEGQRVTKTMDAKLKAGIARSKANREAEDELLNTGPVADEAQLEAEAADEFADNDDNFEEPELEEAAGGAKAAKK